MARGEAGGLALREQYGHEHFVAIGKLGGRPKKSVSHGKASRAGCGIGHVLLHCNDLERLKKALKEEDNA